MFLAEAEPIAYRVHGGLDPEIAQRTVALPTERAQTLPPPAGALTRDHSDVTGHGFAVGEPRRVTQEHLGSQGGDGPTPGCVRDKRETAGRVATAVLGTVQ